MGAADVVPGVSGGTIAFISGIYEELIGSLNNINFSLLKNLKNEGFKSTWKKVNGPFLLALLSGVFVSIISLAKGVEWLLENHPLYKSKLKQVWLWDDWPERWGKDCGIDTVIKGVDRKPRPY